MLCAKNAVLPNLTGLPLRYWHYPVYYFNPATYMLYGTLTVQLGDDAIAVEHVQGGEWLCPT